MRIGCVGLTEGSGRIGGCCKEGQLVEVKLTEIFDHGWCCGNRV